MLYFCTLFDKNYLYRGVAMYRSLVRHCPDFRLYILAMDDEAHNALSALNLSNAVLIKLGDFEDPELLSIKPTRTWGEYCWSITPSLPLYVLKRYPEADLITYIDSDVLFYSNPQPLIDEMKGASVLITEHRYTPKYYRAVNTGKYNVQFVSFRRGKTAFHVLNWWRQRCIEWCYNRLEQGKFGDQKYLDDWPVRFSGIHELQNKGGGVAPWNIQQYDIKDDSGKLYAIQRDTGIKHLLVFYHFHFCHPYTDGTYELGWYKLNRNVIKYLYAPYIEDLLLIEKEVKTKVKGFVYSGSKTRHRGLRGFSETLRRVIKGVNNIFNTKELLGDGF